MQFTRIRSTDDPLFPRIWEIYRTSFPIFEQRTFAHQQTAFGSERYHLNAYTEEGRLIGFIGAWDFDDYLYIEHFAVDPGCRCGGYGSRILKTLQESTPKTIILEIDPVEDEISTRRYNFYSKLGFVMNPYLHPLHRYREEEHRDVFLRILTYPAAIPPTLYERFNNDLEQTVMRK